MNWFNKFSQKYEDFASIISSLKININDLVNQSMQFPPIGTGGNASVFKIQIPELSNYVIRVGHQKNNQFNNLSLNNQHDDFPDINLGQAIANLGNGITIHKRQTGNPAGLRHGINKGNPQYDQALEEYKTRIYEAANMPQESYNNLANTIIKINKNGYVMDPSKSGNILIDFESKKFNLVDLNQSTSNYSNSMSEIAIMLIHNYQFGVALKDNDEYKNLIRIIIEKCKQASVVTGLKFDEQSSSFQYSKKLSE